MSKLDWKDHLHNGEDIVWQGRPDGRFSVGIKDIGSAAFGIFFAGFAVFWMTKASQAGGVFWMFGLIHFSVGASMVFWALFGGVFRRRHTRYTLTNKRAFIATDMPFRGRRLKSYPISPDTSVDYVDAELPSIMFATETRRGNKGTYEAKIGFERIADASEVLSHIRNIQQGAT